MYNIKYVEENFEILKDSAEKKGMNLDFDSFSRINQKRKNIKTEVDEMRRIRNEKGKRVGELKREGKDASGLISELEELKDELQEKEDKLRDTQKEVEKFISWLPNTINPSVKEEPVIRDEGGNIRNFDFEILDHIELGESLGVLDFNSSAKIAGSHFVTYRDKGAKLERALINFMLDLHTKRHGYTEIFPPFLASEDSMFNTGQLPKMREDMYVTERDGFFLNPTAEVPITNILSDTSLEGNKLPLKLCAYTACFRREAGSYGKETKGLLRVHQFNKVELVNFVTPEKSGGTLNILLEEALKVVHLLDLPFRVVQLPFNDLSFASSITYDIEVYAPGVDRWMEVSSVSNFEGFQARRANIRVRGDGNNRYLHTLNASGLATPRLMVSLFENYQNEKGEIEMPEALIPYTGFKKIG